MSQSADPDLRRERRLIDEAKRQAGHAEAPPTASFGGSPRQVSTGLDPLTESLPSPAKPAAERGLPSAQNASALFPGYEIVQEISRGGQGVVYQARQQGTKRLVAIKVLREGIGASDDSRRRFDREIELIGQLRHPGIVTIFQPGVTADGLQYYVMDYVPGRQLHRHVSESKLPLDDILRLFAEVCDAVQYAHQRGIIHRDLKPSNILVDEHGRPRVLDFGLARQILPSREDLTSAGQMMGTLPYMSPEQVTGQQDQVSVITDVYALGVILYQLLVGRYPYPVEGSQYEVLNHILNTPPTSLVKSWSPATGVTLRFRGKRQAGCPIDRDVETMVLKALAKEPARRYQSAGELGRDIRAYLAGEPIGARQDSSWYVLKKLARKNLAASISAAAVFAIAVSSAVICLDLLHEARTRETERQAAEAARAAQARSFDLAAEGVRSALSRHALGWFLLEWEAGRVQSAEQVLAKTPANLPEHAAMRFCLDPAQTPEQLLAAVPQTAAGMASFVAGERAWCAGDQAGGRKWWRESLSRDPAGLLAEAARARLADAAESGG